MGISTPCKIVTPKNFNLKLCTRDYVGEATYHANFGVNRYSEASPQIGEMLPLCDFFDCPVLSCPVLTFYLDPTPRSNRWTDFYALWLKRRVFAKGWFF